MKEFFYKILFYVGVTVVGIIFYFIGNFFFGNRNEGGKRTIIAITGIILGVLGFFPAKFFLEILHKTSGAFGVFLGMTFFGFGFYLLLAALLASQNPLVKLFDGLLRGW